MSKQSMGFRRSFTAQLGLALVLAGIAGFVAASWIDSRKELTEVWDAREHLAMLATNFGLAGILCTVLGGVLLIRFLREQRREKLARLAREFSFTQPGPQPRGFQFGAPPRPATPVAEGSATFWAGAALLVAGMPAYWGLHQWIEAPPFVPIDRPFTLNREYLHTGPFRISLSGGYSFYVDFDSSRSYPGCSYDTLYNRQWELTRLGLFGRHRQVLWATTHVAWNSHPAPMI